MNLSQIYFAHIEKDINDNDIYVDIYADKIATMMFDNAGEIIKVIVTESSIGKYWAWKKESTPNSLFYHIWHDRKQTEKCIGNHLQKEKDGVGCLVFVDVNRWHML